MEQQDFFTAFFDIQLVPDDPTVAGEQAAVDFSALGSSDLYPSGETTASDPALDDQYLFECYMKNLNGWNDDSLERSLPVSIRVSISQKARLDKETTGSHVYNLRF